MIRGLGETVGRRTSALAVKLGVRGDLHAHPIHAGWNNQVYRLEGGALPLLLKVYFRHARDHRDRLGAEYRFLLHAWKTGLRCVPRPLACDERLGIGLYEFVEGRRLKPSEVNARRVAEAMAFYREANRKRTLPSARRLPAASEACFSIAEHLETVGRRVGRLGSIRTASAVDRSASAFVRSTLGPAWSSVEAAVRVAAGKALNRTLKPAERRLSPSDFGFHNAVLRPDDRLCFIDFEYAGWDDPAKMASDFFCQPAVPVPAGLREAVIEAASEESLRSEETRERIRLLRPVYQVKWACIVMNEFLPAGSDRRRFSRGGGDPDARKRRQLSRAKRMLDGLESVE